MQEGKILAVQTPEAVMDSFSQDLWIIQSPGIYATSKKLENIPDLISVNSFGQVLHLVTKKGKHSKESIELFLKKNSEEDAMVERSRASIEDVFILLMKDQHAK
jgi:ABC-type multidrug transport system ATPase subunit